MVRKIAEKTIWFTCIARNAIIVMISLLIAYLLDGPDLDPEADTTFKLTGSCLSSIIRSTVILTKFSN